MSSACEMVAREIPTNLDEVDTHVIEVLVLRGSFD